MPEAYGYSFTPSLVLIDSKGKVAMRMSGFHKGDDKKLLAKLKELMPEPKEG